jgi:hypothetical protein
MACAARRELKRCRDIHQHFLNGCHIAIQADMQSARRAGISPQTPAPLAENPSTPVYAVNATLPLSERLVEAAILMLALALALMLS